MNETSPFANPTPLAHADTSRDVLPRGALNVAALLGIHVGKRSTYRDTVVFNKFEGSAAGQSLGQAYKESWAGSLSPGVTLNVQTLQMHIN
ncbi:hypothetical protein TNCV_2725971 [Trichonephila clavipes]|nr:hypothetical protein TNCV_2725971 [Trichonephila clavipes]